MDIGVINGRIATEIKVTVNVARAKVGQYLIECAVFFAGGINIDQCTGDISAFDQRLGIRTNRTNCETALKAKGIFLIIVITNTGRTNTDTVETTSTDIDTVKVAESAAISSAVIDDRFRCGSLINILTISGTEVVTIIRISTTNQLRRIIDFGKSDRQTSALFTPAV